MVDEKKIKFLMEATGLSRDEVIKSEEALGKLSPEEKLKLEKEAEEKRKMLSMMLPSVIASKIAIDKHSRELHHVAMFGSLAEEYCKKFKCSPMQFINELKFFHKQFVIQSLDIGISFDETVHDIPKEYKERNMSSKPSGMSIRDILKNKKQ